MPLSTHESPPTEERRRFLSIRSLGWTLLIGLLFVLPHIAGIVKLGGIRDYTPFSVTTPSNVTWDESFLYGAQTNTMLQQHRRADDTDTWEGRGTWFPYSILPEAAEAATAAVLAPGHPRTGLKLAQMLFHFVFPAIMAALLMALFDRPGLPSAVAALLALLVMVVSFSARTLTGGALAVLSRYGASGIATPLQAARNPNPNVSFVVALAAIYLCVRACRKPGWKSFVLAGSVGGLLFYCYTFYAVAWAAACLLLAIGSWLPVLRMPRHCMLLLCATVVTALPYGAWSMASKRSGVYAQRVGRLGMVYTHHLSPTSLHNTLVFGLLLLAMAVVWIVFLPRVSRWSGSQDAHSAILASIALGLGGIAGLDMQLVTGFNVQADFHYTHMVIQPALVLTFALMASVLLSRWHGVRWFGLACFAVFYAVCAVVEVNAGVAGAPYQRLSPDDAALFDWLAVHTKPGEVLGTNSLRLCLETPLFTHNRLLLASGTRASGTDRDLLERLLLAHRLEGVPESQVKAELAGESPATGAVFMETNGTYLFENSPLLNPYIHVLTADAVSTAMEQYRAMQIDDELKRYRVDYVYTEHGAEPHVGLMHKAEAAVRTPGGGVLWHVTLRT